MDSTIVNEISELSTTWLGRETLVATTSPTLHGVNEIKMTIQRRVDEIDANVKQPDHRGFIDDDAMIIIERNHVIRGSRHGEIHFVSMTAAAFRSDGQHDTALTTHVHEFK